MADIICPRCGEPWDAFGIRNDMAAPVASFGPAAPRSAEAAEEQVRANWGATAPPEIVDLTITLARVEADFVALGPIPDDDPRVVRGEAKMKEARDALGKAVYATGLSKGCPACWDDPSRIPDEEGQMENLRAAIFDGVWDGDPAELFG